MPLKGSEAYRAVVAYPKRLGDTRLRLATPDDAEFTLRLRLDSRLNQHLSATSGSLDDQRAWLERYTFKEANGEEFYFLIESVALNKPIGTVRIYDFRENSFCWGSWILSEDKRRMSALESAILVYRIGFDCLRYPASHFDVRKQNEAVLRFHEKWGARKTGEDELNDYFLLDEPTGRDAMNRFEKLIQR